MKNKKANIPYLYIFIVISVLVSVTIIGIGLHSKINLQRFSLGEIPNAILDTYHKTAQNTFYIEKAADIALYSAIGKMVGSATTGECGTYSNYYLINNKDTGCFINEILIQNQFINDFKRILVYYGISIDGYEIFFKKQDDKSIITGLKDYEYQQIHITNINQKQIKKEEFDRLNLYIDKDKTIYGNTDEFIWPLEKEDGYYGYGSHQRIVSCIGPRNCKGCSSDHKGIDIGGIEGEPVYSICDGTVKYASSYSSYGTVGIECSRSKYYVRYLHNKDRFVTLGEKVGKGQLIATIGNTGPQGTNYPYHLHLEIAKRYEDNIKMLEHIDPLEDIYDIEEYKIRATQNSNCYYNSQNYAYADYVKKTVIV